MKLNLNKASYYMFFLSYSFFLAFSFFGHIEMLETPLKAFTYLSMFLLIFIFFINIEKYTKQEILTLIIIFIFSLIYGIKNSDYSLLKLSLMFIGLKNIEVNKCIKFDFYLRIIYFIIMIYLFKTGIANDVISYFEGKYRSSLGFTNSNTFGMHILIFSFELIYLKLKKINLLQIILFIILAITSDIINGSRTTTLVMIIAIILFITTNKNQKFLENKVIKLFITNSALITSLIVITLTILYIKGTPAGIMINKVLSYRLYNISDYIQSYGISLLGHNLQLENAHTIDTTIAYIYLRFGICGITMYLVFFKKMFSYLYKTKNYLLIIILFCFNIYGISERLWLNVDYNIFMIIFSLLLFKNNSDKI